MRCPAAVSSAAAAAAPSSSRALATWSTTSQTLIRSSMRGVPPGFQIGRAEQAGLPRDGPEDSGAAEPVCGRVGRACQDISLARRRLVPFELPEPLEAEPGVGVEVALLLRQHLVKRVVDQRQGGADGHVCPIGLDDLRIAREDGHSGTDRRLGQVDGGDGSLLQLLEGRR